jgi:hypothetical protein
MKLPERITAGPRAESAGMMAAGLAAVIACAWFPHLWLLIPGAAVAALSAAMLISELRWSPEKREQDRLTRLLWHTARRLPTGCTLQDPLTSTCMTVERERRALILAVTEPDNISEDATVTRYVLGSGGAPHGPPPLLRHTAGIGDRSPVWMSWQQRGWLHHFNEVTGVAEVTSADLSELRAQLGRAIAAAQAHPGA